MKEEIKTIKPIAIVLPQFHPIKENNEWWGEGFTDWSNVVKGKPLFKGHYQPHLPKDLGFYDLRLSETREAQASLAKNYGIYGFCYYHYWFNGRRVLERPVDDILKTKKPDFPFMLCWANENWSRNWDGGFNKILLEQNYSIEDFVNHARHLVQYFSDSRYIRIDNKPVFAIYKYRSIPNIKNCIDAFREELLKYNIDVYLCGFESFFGAKDNLTETIDFFDGGIEFQPHTRQFYEYIFSTHKYLRIENYINYIVRKFNRSIDPSNKIYNYSKIIENDLKYNFQKGKTIFPCVTPGWDNSVRRPHGGALILNNSTPDLFQYWIEEKIKLTDWSLLPENFLFINAWNEWAEGNHLEPCEKWGRKYLEALHKGISNSLLL